METAYVVTESVSVEAGRVTSIVMSDVAIDIWVVVVRSTSVVV
jgi:hypothetical protein